jgi:putative hydrolase of the HAD superfamily
MKKYTHIYFDLDRTLWDFQKNSTAALSEILSEFSLDIYISNEEEFVRGYNEINDGLWVDFRKGRIRKTDLRRERFRRLLARYGVIDRKLIDEVSRFYLNAAPVKTALMENALEVLEYLVVKYKLYVISNGFYDVQLTKVINSGISRYITKVFTSDRIGFAKPKEGIFEYALSSENARKENCLMVGDDFLNDIKGAQRFGIDQVFYNPANQETEFEPTHEIKDLIELKGIL